jgi:hypothetical protein
VTSFQRAVVLVAAALIAARLFFHSQAYVDVLTCTGD